jgi:ATP-dependent DNA ligase
MRLTIFDGERCVARRDGGEVRLESRTAKDLAGTYPEIQAAVAAQRARGVLLDGEVVAYDGEQTSFSRLQLSAARRGESQRRFAEACRSGWEGLIAR